MNNLFITITLCIFVFNIASSQTFFDEAVNKGWEGTGTLMGSPATFKMAWEKTLNGEFYKLEFQNQITNNGKAFTFKATAFYKVLSDSTFIGTWFDSRGMTFPVKGNVSKNELIVDWGTPETEMGKSIYSIMENGQIKVLDYIEQKEKEVKFGEAIYKSKSD